MKSLIASVGNPIIFFVLLFAHVPGTINDLNGNMYQISLFGLMLLVACGYLYLVICAILRKIISRKSTIPEYIRQISATMFRLSLVGLIVPILLFFA